MIYLFLPWLLNTVADYLCEAWEGAIQVYTILSSASTVVAEYTLYPVFRVITPHITRGLLHLIGSALVGYYGIHDKVKSWWTCSSLCATYLWQLITQNLVV